MNQAQFITLLLQIMSISVLGVVILFFIIKYKEIMSFLKPQNWAEITMIESDNNISRWLQKKNSDLRFTFNEGLYNMFDTDPRNSNVYRKGRLSAFIFAEGIANPLNIKSNEKFTSLPQMTKQFKMIDITKLWSSDNSGFMELINKYGIILLLGVLGIIIVILVNNQ